MIQKNHPQVAVRFEVVRVKAKRQLKFVLGFGKLFLLTKEQTKIIMRLIAVGLQLRREAQMSERLEVIPLA